jgi:hypothetical protein
MTTQEEALEFFEKLTDGTEHYKTISLEAGGEQLDGFKMHIVSKGVVADIVDRLPDEMFEEGLEVDEDVEAEDLVEEEDMDATATINRETVAAFEDLCMTSLSHQHLSKSQISDMIENFDFDVLFGIGGEILEYSIENAGDIKDFHVQS